jgi:hypothetical protein
VVPLLLQSRQAVHCSAAADRSRHSPLVHARVGAAVGAAVGAVVGAAVGALVGDVVGVLVGSGLGCRVGTLVGLLVGAGVGANVGVLVGTATQAVAASAPTVHAPGRQAWHAWYAALSWYLPDGQWMQLLDAAHAWYRPVLQA